MEQQAALTSRRACSAGGNERKVEAGDAARAATANALA